ncbi:MFS transporter [Haloactinomyces albus]|uniref:MFS family permease n=1 Tax=Haloactinomyces albus TaxID=1352928 RepID=A0AAE4CNK4_9ACTN|nr:MFS transporter [Haloactinomyces albus]MDR7303566.1 MFS family permease [Haloactinomyces albus]
MNLPTARTSVSVQQEYSPPTRRKAWLVTALLGAFMIINFGEKAVLGLVAKPAMAELGISPVQFGFIGSSFFFLFSLSAIVVGVLSSRVSSRKLIAVMALVWALVQFPIFFGGGAAVLLVCRIILGAGEGPALPIALHATQNWFPAEDRSLPSNVIAIGATLGAVVAAPLLSLVIDSPALGWRWAFGLLGIASLLWAIAWLAVGRDGPYQSGERTEDGASVSPSSTEKLELVSVRKVLTSTMWIAAVAAGFACFWSQAVLTTWGPRYIGGVLEIGESKVGLIFALPWLFGTVLLIVLGGLGQRFMRSGGSARWGVAGLFGLALVLSGTCMLLMVHTSGALAIVLFTVGWGAFLVFPMAPTAVGYAVNPSQRAVVVSTLVGLASIGGVVSPTVVGYFVERAGDAARAGLASGLTDAFTLTGVLLLITGVASVALINPERTAARLQRHRQRV